MVNLRYILCVSCVAIFVATLISVGSAELATTTPTQSFSFPVHNLLSSSSLSLRSFATHSHAITSETCPENGVWPTDCIPHDGGNFSAGQPCPSTGIWPEGCIPQQNGNGSDDSVGGNSGGGQPCPSSGIWPQGCVPQVGGGNVIGAGGGQGQPCPSTGAWPQGCVPQAGGGNNGSDPDGDSIFGGRDKCPNQAENINKIRDEDGCPDNLRSYMQSHTDTLNWYWNGEFERIDRIYREPIFIEYDYGEPDEPPNAFYVPILNSMVLDLRLLNEAIDEFGDYSAATVLAHEWGHMIQDYLRILTPDRLSRNVELQADCFAGSYTKYAQTVGMIENSDPQEALAIMFSIGDDALGFDLSHGEDGAHGTSEERQAAFQNGYTNGTQACYTTYP